MQTLSERYKNMAGFSGQPLMSVPALISGACKCEVAKESLKMRCLKILRYRDCLDCLGEPPRNRSLSAGGPER